MIQALLSSLSIVSWSCNTDKDEDTEVSYTAKRSAYPISLSCATSLNWYAYHHFRRTSSMSRGTIKRGYIDSLAKKTDLSATHLIAAMVYSNRVKQTDPSFLESISSSDLFLVSILVASKFLYDEGEDGALLNSEWAEIGHRRQSTVNSLEREFLKALDWDVFVSNDEFNSFADSISARDASLQYNDQCLDRCISPIVQSVPESLSSPSHLYRLVRFALQHGLNNGWFSYSDLTALWLWWKKYHLSNPLTWDILRTLLLCSIVYIAGVSSLLAATTLMKSFQSGLPLTTVATIKTCNNSLNELCHQNNTESKHSPCSTVMVMSLNSMDTSVSSRCGNSLEEIWHQNNTESKNSLSSCSTVMVMSINSTDSSVSSSRDHSSSSVVSFCLESMRHGACGHQGTLTNWVSSRQSAYPSLF